MRSFFGVYVLLFAGDDFDAFFMYSIKKARKTAMNNATTLASKTIFFTLFDLTELVSESLTIWTALFTTLPRYSTFNSFVLFDKATILPSISFRFISTKAIFSLSFSFSFKKTISSSRYSLSTSKFFAFTAASRAVFKRNEEESSLIRFLIKEVSGDQKPV
jgi:hypothetical protein